MSDTLITGVDITTGVYLAAELLISSDNAVYVLPQSCDADLEASIRELLTRMLGQRTTAGAEAASRCAGKSLALIGGGQRNDDLGNVIRDHQIQQVWFFGSSSLNPSELERSAEFALDLAAVLAGSGVSHFRYVRSSYAVKQIDLPMANSDFECLGGAEAERRHRIVEDQLLDICRQAGVQCSMFCIPAIIGECHSVTGTRASGFSSFLVGLHEYKAEIEERYLDYFEHQALRCLAPDMSYLNLMSAETAAITLFRLAQDGETDETFNQIVASQNVLFSEFCTRVGLAYGLSLLTVADAAELNAIDRLFNERVACLWAFLTVTPTPAVRASCRVTLADGSLTGDSPVLAALGKIRQLQDAALRERNQLAETAPAALRQIIVSRNDSEISYFVDGSEGTPVVLLNALGQGLHYWNRLLFEIRRQHRVIIWVPRAALSGEHVCLQGHANDLETVLQREKIEECHLVAWCTGPKVAVNFCLRHPKTVASMVFLNAAFKSTSTAPELTTDYEQRLEPLFRLLDRSPGVAGVVMKSLRQYAIDAAIPDPARLDSNELADRVLSLTNLHLLSDVIAPFHSEESTVNYARQVLEFYSYDIRAEASKISVPVLLIGAERDQIASPAISRAFAEFFPRGRYVEIKGATHYCLYDRAPFLAGLMEDFFETNKQLVIDGQESHKALALQP